MKEKSTKMRNKFEALYFFVGLFSCIEKRVHPWLVDFIKEPP